MTSGKGNYNILFCTSELINTNIPKISFSTNYIAEKYNNNCIIITLEYAPFYFILFFRLF